MGRMMIPPKMIPPKIASAAVTLLAMIQMRNPKMLTVSKGGWGLDKPLGHPVRIKDWCKYSTKRSKRSPVEDGQCYHPLIIVNFAELMPGAHRRILKTTSRNFSLP